MSNTVFDYNLKVSVQLAIALQVMARDSGGNDRRQPASDFLYRHSVPTPLEAGAGRADDGPGSSGSVTLESSKLSNRR